MSEDPRDNKLRPLNEALRGPQRRGHRHPEFRAVAAVDADRGHHRRAGDLRADLWSFFGHADVIVTAHGTLAPESEVRRFYAPVDGELADLYVAEGQPVSKDDVLARLNARGAIEAAASALEAQLKLEDSEREWKQFPERKVLMERRAQALKQQIELGTRQHENRMAEGTTRLAEQQRAQLQEARSNLENARRARDFARQEQDRYARLFALPAGGGVSQSQVEGKRAITQDAENNLRVAQSRLTSWTRGCRSNTRRPAPSWRAAARSWPTCASSTTPRCARSATPRTSCACRCRPPAWWPRPPRASSSRTSTRTTSC